jgi:hypothetical protein
MNKLTIYRKNDFWGSINVLTIIVNNEIFKLPNNSNIVVDIDSNEINIQAKYLWLSSKKMTIKNNNVNKIRIAPFINNYQLVISAIIMILLFVLSSLLEFEVFAFLFRIFTISFLLIIFFFLSLGCRNYFKITINEND